MVSKNSYGISTVMSPKVLGTIPEKPFSGSSLDRKVYPKKEKDFIEELLKIPLDEMDKKVEKKPKQLRRMSDRTKSKVRKKIIAFARIHKKLSFLTLTFCNRVEDKQAVQILAKFLENANKRSKDFQYIWVAEKQAKNTIFKDNIHFHLITNKFWKIDSWWKYWIDLQARHGLRPRDENYKPSSAFDVKNVTTNNIKGVSNYLTKYVSKNSSQFDCQVWNCSKKISRLYTAFYSGFEFIRELERLQKLNQLEGEIKFYPMEYCNVHLIPLNRQTIKFYHVLEEMNRQVWNNESIEKNKEVQND